MNNLKTRWPNIKAKLIQLVGGLIMEKDLDTGLFIMSSGKVMLWAVFGAAMEIWVHKNTDIPSTMFNMLMVLVSYNLGKKVLPVVQAIFGKGNNTVPEELNTEPTPKDNSTKGINQE